MWRWVQFFQNKKIFFFIFYPHTLTFRLKRPVYRGFSGEGKCEGKLSPLTLALTTKIRLKFLLPSQGTIKMKNEETTFGGRRESQ